MYQPDCMRLRFVSVLVVTRIILAHHSVLEWLSLPAHCGDIAKLMWQRERLFSLKC